MGRKKRSFDKKSNSTEPKPRPNDSYQTIDGLDHKIILELQQDARKPYKTIAHKYGVSDATIGQRVKNMVARGILKLEARVDPLVLEHKIAALIAINVDRITIINELKKLENRPYVTCVWTASGPYSIFIEVMFDSLRDLNEIFLQKELKNVNGITRTETFILLDSNAKFFKLS